MAKNLKRSKKKIQKVTDEDIEEFLLTPLHSSDGKTITFAPEFAKSLKKTVRTKKDLAKFREAIRKADFSKGKPIFPH